MIDDRVAALAGAFSLLLKYLDGRGLLSVSQVATLREVLLSAVPRQAEDCNREDVGD